MATSIRVKKYANKHGKAAGTQNKVQVSMDVEDAVKLSKGDKDVKAEFDALLKEGIK